MSENVSNSDTKHKIQSSFLTLLSNKSIEKITIREICTLANIHRGTFYHYYGNIFYLSNEIENDLLKKFETILSNSSTCTLQETIKDCIYFIYRESTTCRIFLKHKSNSDILDKIADMSKSYLINKTPLIQLNDSETQYMVNCISAGVLGIVQLWIEHDFQEPPDTIINCLNRCMSDLFYQKALINA